MSMQTLLIRWLKIDTIVAAIALATFGALGSAAMAQEPSAAPTAVGTVKVSLAGLDLSTAEGISAARAPGRTPHLRQGGDER